MLCYPLFIGTWEIVIIVAVIVLLFGGRKIPELMKGIGQGVTSFKKGMQEAEDQINQAEKEIKAPLKKKEEPKADDAEKPQE